MRSGNQAEGTDMGKAVGRARLLVLLVLAEASGKETADGLQVSTVG